MNYMFDTDTVSFFMKNNPKEVRVEFAKHEKDEFFISSITYAELMFGLKKNYSKQLDFWLNEVYKKFKIIPFDETSSVIYGEIRANLEKSGNPFENMDVLIASSALAEKAVLVSHNIKHFSKVKGLKVEDWSK